MSDQNPKTSYATKVDHIGVAVEDLNSAVEMYQNLLGFAPNHFEEIPSEKVKTAFFELGDTNIELLEATDPSSPIAKFIGKQGRGGIHHICIEVSDIRLKLAELKEKGFQLIHEEPKSGAHGKLVAFVHPKSTKGVLIELSQETHG